MAPKGGYSIASLDEMQRTGSWQLVRRTLDCGSFGINVVQIPPGESIPEHDEVDRDQEEIFFVLSGSTSMVIDGTPHPAPSGTFVRLDPQLRRTVQNDGDEVASVLIVSAPTTSGYRPMDWA
jgi:uncharacterized cupin superfamily protein